jgi:hypothetical protein
MIGVDVNKFCVEGREGEIIEIFLLAFLFKSLRVISRLASITCGSNDFTVFNGMTGGTMFKTNGFVSSTCGSNDFTVFNGVPGGEAFLLQFSLRMTNGLVSATRSSNDFTASNGVACEIFKPFLLKSSLRITNGLVPTTCGSVDFTAFNGVTGSNVDFVLFGGEILFLLSFAFIGDELLFEVSIEYIDIGLNSLRDDVGSVFARLTRITFGLLNNKDFVLLLTIHLDLITAD